MLLVCCFSALVAGTGVALAETNPGRLPVFRVDVDGLTPYAVGADLGAQWKEVFPELEYRLDALLADRLRNSAREQAFPFQAALSGAGGLGDDYLAELEGLAGALELVGGSRLGDGLLSRDELMLVQRLPDLGAYEVGAGFGVYGSRSDIGGPVVGRNLDSMRDGEAMVQSLDAISVYRSDGGTLASIGLAGSLGITTGFNERGLFLALIPASGVPERGREASSVEALGFALRGVLETQEDIEGAASLLGSGRYGSSHSLLLADRDQVQVLERAAGGSVVLRTASSEVRPRMMWERPEQIAVVGCFASTAMPSGCVDSLDLYRWKRLRALAGFTPKGDRAEIADVTDIMLDRINQPNALYTEKTRQVLVFAPRTADLYLLARGLMANESAQSNMHRYADLLQKPAGASGGFLSFRTLLWALIAAMLGTMLWIRLRKRSATGWSFRDE